MAYVQPAEISVLLGVTFSTAEIAQCAAFIAEAEGDILFRIPDLAAREIAGTTKAADVARVVRRAVRRVMLNPDAKDNEKVDDYSFGRSDSVASGELVITDEEWSWLVPSVSPGDSFSITMANAGPRVITPYWRERDW